MIAAVVRVDGRFLLCKRPEGKRYGGFWEFPGGKLLDGEGFEEAAIRELAEELQLRVLTTGGLLHSIPDADSHFVIHFVETCTEGQPVAHEHEEVRWVGTNELLTLRLAPADKEFSEYLTRSHSDAIDPVVSVAARLLDSPHLSGPAQVTVWTAIAAAGRTWGTPVNDLGLCFQISNRMTRCLGRCYPDRRLVRLNSALLAPELSTELAEVAVHEAAHVVVHDRYGKVRPHGSEWSDLLRQAGYEPRVRLRVDGAEFLPQKSRPQTGRRLVFEHRCPVCQTSRIAARPMRRWRCATCAEMGLGGELEIISLSARPPKSR